ncbi:hypothetical protein, partial [Clostridium fessum]|uniref:hypothetical protein n=1 Tax=Clostridium fessum TaxID=2126740 RepID=UPI0029420CE5
PIGQSNEKPPLQALAKWRKYVTEYKRICIICASGDGSGTGICIRSCNVRGRMQKGIGIGGKMGLFCG